MIPLIIGAATIGLAGLALSGDDKKNSTTTTREIPPSEVPPDVREKLDNSSTGDDKMNGSKFTILGESLSGKTCYLLAMYCEMSQGVNGYSIVAQDDNLDTELLEAFERLDDESISQERFPGATDDVQTYLFNLNYAHKPILPFEWVDYPGGVLRHKDEHYDKIAKTIKESSTLFICVDGKLLVGNDTARKIRNVKRKCSMTINRYFGKYFEAGGKLPPVGIILTKADLFSHDTNDEEIREILQEAFSPLFFSRDTQVGVIPVTLGENIQDDNYCGEVDPVNIHLPIFMGIWFALNYRIQEYADKLASNRTSTNELQNKIHDNNSRIRTLEQSISNMDYIVRDEKDSFWLWRDDKKIDNLQRNINQSKGDIIASRNEVRNFESTISRNNEEAKKIQSLLEAMKRDREMFQSYLNQIMWFFNGRWQVN